MNIRVTKRAKQKYDEIRTYIIKDFGKLAATKFDNKVADFLSLLSIFPEMGTLEVSDKKIRGFVVAKQTKVFYRIKGQTIIILTFFEVRQHPDRRLK